MNEELTNLYQEKMESLTVKLQNFDEKPTNPLLIQIEEENYKNADIKIMIFGQETFDFEGEFGSKSIEHLLQTYDTFFNKGECYNYGGNFWNTVNDYKKSIQSKYPDKNIALVWNNILKIGKEGDKGAPSEEIIKITQQEFSVIPNEIEILKPDVIIFFTGPNYDEYISNTFEEVIFEKFDHWDIRYLSKLKSESFPLKTFRTYHPRPLQCPNDSMKQKYPDLYNDVKKAIIDSI